MLNILAYFHSRIPDTLLSLSRLNIKKKIHQIKEPSSFLQINDNDPDKLLWVKHHKIDKKRKIPATGGIQE